MNPARFQNDTTSVTSRDDALTVLVHLGYPCYDIGTHRTRVPNEEVRGELANAVEASRHAGVAHAMLEKSESSAPRVDSSRCR